MKTHSIKVSKQEGIASAARAVASQKFALTLTDYRINIFMYEQGRYSKFDYYCLGTVFSGTLKALHSYDSSEYREIREGLKVTRQAEARGWTWSKEHTVTLDNALAAVQSETCNLFRTEPRY